MVDPTGRDLMFCLTLCCALCFAYVAAAPEFQFSFGRIAGVDNEAEDTLKPYYAYYGIPFAEPPMGNLRFRSPRPFKGSNPNAIISSNSFRARCIQIPYDQVDRPNNPFSEDCLHLNVFTPANINSGGALKKVMLFIHGGGYVSGDANQYIPSRMVTDYDVIVVTIQYRLGLFGFMDVGSGGEANVGLRDQIMAIQWVKDNIGQFGGDGEDITLFGESAGAGSISLLSLSPLAKGLFTKGILQSGTALSPWAVNKDPESQFLKVARNLGCLSWLQTFDFIRERYVDDIMDCLRTKTANDVLFAPYREEGDDRVTIPGGGLDDDGNDEDEDEEVDIGKEYLNIYENLQGPTVDGVVIPRNPESLLADRAYLQANGVLDRAYIVGFNNNEGIVQAYQDLQIPRKGESFVKVMASYAMPQPVTDDVMDFVLYEYTYPRGDQGKLDVMNVCSVQGDTMFAIPSVKFVRALAAVSDRTPIYLYLFDHYPELVNPDGPLKGAIHTMDLSFEFDRNPAIDSLSSFYARLHTPTDQPLYNVVRNSFTQFAKTGVPDSQEYPSWPRYRLQDQSYMALATQPEVRQRVFGKRVDLWTEVLPKRASQSFRSRRFRLY